MTPAIFGLSGSVLTSDERAFFSDAKPAGYIMFKRNCVSAAQLRALTDSLRDLEGRDDVAILIDQEGGRVMRMQPPEWPSFPPGDVFGRLYDIAPISAMEAARVNALALAVMLRAAGITVNCLPLLDVRVADTHPAIGDRAFGENPLVVASLGRAVLDGLREGGIVGVVKHMPGQGRARVDSHLTLPVVDADEAALDTDLLPFQRLSDAPMGMTGHIIFPAWDAEHCATHSRVILHDIVRERIGFDGLLMSDDLDMQALSGDVPARAAACVTAGCDIALNCWGRMDEMVGIARLLPTITHDARERLARAMAWASTVPQQGMPPYHDLPTLLAKRDELLALI